MELNPQPDTIYSFRQQQPDNKHCQEMLLLHLFLNLRRGVRHSLLLIFYPTLSFFHFSVITIPPIHLQT